MSFKIFLLYIKWSLSSDIIRWRHNVKAPKPADSPDRLDRKSLDKLKIGKKFGDLRIKSTVIYGNHLDDYVHWGSVAQLGQGADLSKIGSKHKPPKPVVVGSKPTGPA
jgi:hypothetical protein